MKNEQPKPVERLADLLVEMQRIQAAIAADEQPLSMHELDALKRLGVEYAALIAQIEAEDHHGSN